MEQLDILKNRQLLVEEYIPAKSIMARFIYLEENRIMEWIFSREGRAFQTYLIEHTEEEMRSIGDQALLDRLKEKEMEHRILENIAAAFYIKRRVQQQKQQNRKNDFETHLEMFEELEQMDFDEGRLSRDEIRFFNDTMRELKKEKEGIELQKNNIFWRDCRTDKYERSSILRMMERLHQCYPISMKMKGFSFSEAHGLFSIQRIRRMTGVGYRWMNWKIYAYWHDEYFYLFSSTKTNPSSFEEMYRKMKEKELRDFKVVFQQNLQSKPFNVRVSDENQRLDFLTARGMNV